MSVKEALEQRIAATYALIGQYEDVRREASDPKEQARARRAIAEQHAVLADAVGQYVRVCRGMGLALAQEVVAAALACGIVLEPHDAAGGGVAATATGGVALPVVQHWPVELREALERGSVALFIGADMGRAVTGVPSRGELAAELAQRHGLAPTLSLAEVAQRVSSGGNRHRVLSVLLDALDTHGRVPQPFHRGVAALVVRYRLEWLVTTAYDDLLEAALRDVQVRVNRVVRTSDLPFVRRGEPVLIKLYGDAGDKESLVVTTDDHYRLWRSHERAALLDAVRAVLGRSVVLLLGYDLQDADFLLLWGELRDRLGHYGAVAYAAGAGVPAADAAMWRERGIVLLEELPGA